MYLFFTLQNADIFLTRCVGGKDPAGDTGVARGHTVAQEQEGDVPVLEECHTTWCCCRLSDASAAVCGCTQPGIAKHFVLDMERAGSQLGKPVQGHPDLVCLCFRRVLAIWKQGHISIAHWRAGPGANWSNRRTGDTSSVQPDEDLHPEQHLSPARVAHGFSKPYIPHNSLPHFLSDDEG